MELKILESAQVLGRYAAVESSKVIKEAIEKKGFARIVLSTGMSQFETIQALLEQDVQWQNVEMFHLDEYIDLPESHKASFRKYLKERFTTKISLKNVYFVGEGDPLKNIEYLTTEIRKYPVDLGVIGIGQNAHIAFNDPPADFETKDAYKIVELDEVCKKQQVEEQWFATKDEVPDKAISMTVYQILQCEKIISCVPHEEKANAIYNTLMCDSLDPEVPASALKTHKDWMLLLDENSASTLPKEYRTNL